MSDFLGLVGARPGRLVRYRAVLGEVADAMVTRAHGVDAAVAGYVARTELAFQADVGPVVGAVEALSEVVRDLGAWVGAVGESFVEADMAEALASGSSSTWLTTIVFDRVAVSSPEAFGDRFAEVAPPVLPGSSLSGGDTSGGDDDGGLLDWIGPDDAVTALGALAQVARSPGAASAARGTAVAALLESDRFGRIATGVSRVATGVSVVTAAHGRWQADRDLDLHAVERVGRAATQAAIETGAAALGAAAGAATFAAAGATIGVGGGPVGVAIGTVGGAVLGSIAGGIGADRLLDDDPPRPEPEEVGAAVAAVDDDVVDEIVDEVAVIADDAGAVPDWRDIGRETWADPSSHAAGFEEAGQLVELAVEDDPWPGDPPMFEFLEPTFAREIATGEPG